MIRKLLIVVCVLLSANLCYAQTRKLTGTITDAEAGTPLAGAKIAVKGTPATAFTNAEGKYTINVSGDNAFLIITYIGYNNQEVAVAKKTEVNVRLQATTSIMDEVVILGYQAVKPRDLTGSVTTLDAAKALKDNPSNSAADALTGRLAGVQITASEGSLESDPRIVIRGGNSITQDNSPLYIIDGVQVEDGFKSLSPQDIARIDVLKDASATSIYGSRGSNGVVVITTKSGKAGSATVNYNGLYGTSTLPQTLDVMSPWEYVMYQYERFKGNEGTRSTFARRFNTQPTDPTLPLVTVPDFADLQKYKAIEVVDWQREVVGNVAHQQTHNLSINGGTTTGTKYNFSFTHANQTGIMLETALARNLLSAKIDQKVNQKLDLGFTLRYTQTENNGSSTSDAGNAQLNGLRNFVKYRPYLLPDEEIDGEFNEEEFNATNLGGGLGLLNPVAGTKAKYRKVNSDVTNLGGNLNYKIDDAFSVRVNGGMNFNNNETNTFRQALRTIEFPSAAFQTGNDKTYNQSAVLNYSNARSKSKFSKKNKISTVIGEETFISQNEDLYNSLRNYPRGITPEIALTQLTQGTQVTRFPNQEFSRNTLLSYFGRANYTYNNKYLAAIAFRADGSSKFAPGSRWGYFPSGSFAWRVSDEDFMKKVTWVSDVKVRASYGVSANNRIRDYAYMSTFDATALYGLGETLTNTFGYEALQLPTQDLKWETTLQSNLALDFSFLKDRVVGTFEYYSNRTNDVITQIAIPLSTGYATQLKNIADTRNRGVELQLSGQIVKKKNFTWDADFNIAANRNTVQKLASGLESQEFASGWVSLGNYTDYLVQVGESIGNMYGYVSDGFYKVDDFNTVAIANPTTSHTHTYTLKPGVVSNAALFNTTYPGGLKIKDLNGDGIISVEDKKIIGNAIPWFFGGLNQQFTFKNFDASFFVNFSVGNDILNANKIEFTNGYTDNQNMSKIMEGRWRTADDQGNSLQSAPPGLTAVAPEILAEANKGATLWQPIRSNPGYFTTDWAVEDGSFLRLNNISLGYTFQANLLSKIKVKRARLYVTANNLAVITNYTGYDPEVNTRRSSGLTPGVDYSAYPRSRTFVFGLNLSL